jgi:hypothetical protein
VENADVGTDPWKLTSTDPRAEAPGLLWNGLIGVRLGPSGAAYDAEGAPLPAFSIDEYEKTGEEKIRTLQSPLMISWTVSGQQLSPVGAAHYENTLDLATGLMHISWTQRIADMDVKVAVTTGVPLDRRIVVQRWSIELPKTAEVIFKRAWPENTRVVAEGDGLHIYPKGATGSWLFVNRGLQGLSGADFYQAGGESRIESSETGVVSLDSIAVYTPPTRGPAQPTSGTLEDVAAGWRQRWATDIVIDGPVEDQQAIRSWLFYLRSAIQPDSKMAISPLGLSNDTYFGHVFWDADVWVFPALAFVDPEAARAIPNYRLERLAAARSNYSSWFDSGGAIGNNRNIGRMGGTGVGAKAAMRPMLRLLPIAT